MALPVMWDAELSAEEVRRCAEKGCHSLSFSENPATLGYPSFHNEYWDPLWQAVCDTGTVLSIHLGSSGKLLIPTDDGPPDVMITLQPMNIACGGGGPAVVAGAQGLPRHPHCPVRGWQRVDPLLPRAGGPDLRHAPRVDTPGLREALAQRGLPRAL